MNIQKLFKNSVLPQFIYKFGIFVLEGRLIGSKDHPEKKARKNSQKSFAKLKQDKETLSIRF